MTRYDALVHRGAIMLASLFALGCAHVRAREAIAALESDCFHGDSLACLAAAKYWMVAGEPARAGRLESRSCTGPDTLETCHRLGIQQLADGMSSVSYSTLHRACVFGLDASCEVLRWGMAASMLDRHPWVWECLSEADPALDSVAIDLSFTNSTPRGPATAVIEQLGPTDIELRQCLDEVFAATDFLPLRHGEFVRFVYVASLAPEHVAWRLQSNRHNGHEHLRVEDADQQPPPDACLDGTSLDCVVVPLDQLRLIYTPSIDTRALQNPRSPTAPRSFEASMAFCVDLNGRISKIDAIGDVEPEIAEALAAEIGVWRIKQWSIDGRNVEACSARTFAIDLRWSGP